jgi:hypothetical protein
MLFRLGLKILTECPYPDQQLDQLLDISTKIYRQHRHDKNKVYSVHAPEVECISKGKSHKRSIRACFCQERMTYLPAKDALDGQANLTSC